MGQRTRGSSRTGVAHAHWQCSSGFHESVRIHPPNIENPTSRLSQSSSTRKVSQSELATPRPSDPLSSFHACAGKPRHPGKGRQRLRGGGKQAPMSEATACRIQRSRVGLWAAVWPATLRPSEQASGAQLPGAAKLPRSESGSINGSCPIRGGRKRLTRLIPLPVSKSTEHSRRAAGRCGPNECKRRRSASRCLRFVLSPPGALHLVPRLANPPLTASFFSTHYSACAMGHSSRPDSRARRNARIVRNFEAAQQGAVSSSCSSGR
jgi:hypothetical protein